MLNAYNLLDSRFADVMVVMTWLPLVMRVVCMYEYQTWCFGGLAVGLAGVVRSTYSGTWREEESYLSVD